MKPESAEKKILANTRYEQMVLSQIMTFKHGFERASVILTPEDFHRESHAAIYRAYSDLFDRKAPINFETVATELEGRNQLESVGGLAYLIELDNHAPTVENIEFFANEVASKALLRKQAEACLEAYSIIHSENENVDELINSAQSVVCAVERASKDELTGPAPIVEEAMRDLNTRAENRGRLRGMSTGFYRLDEVTSGLKKSSLIIIAARTSMGKTSLCRDIVDFCCDMNDAVVLFFSQEMSKNEVIEQMICAKASIDSLTWDRGLLTSEQQAAVKSAAEIVSNYKIEVLDSMYPVNQLSGKCRQVKRKYGRIDLVVLDYIQRVVPDPRDYRETEAFRITKTAKTLKTIAKEFKIPVIGIAQINRGAESDKDDKRPHLTHLKGSGGLEEEADVVGLLYREAYYKNTEFTRDFVHTDKPTDYTPEKVELNIAKNRKGPKGFIKLGFIAKCIKFVDAPEDDPYADEFIGDGPTPI